MARHMEPTAEQAMEWQRWLSDKPEIIRQLAAKYPPEILYRMKSTGHRVCIYSYAEDGKVSVVVSSLYNLVAMNRLVFGVDPEDLEECDLPGPGEKVGLAESPVKAIVDIILGKVGLNPEPPTKHQQLVNNVSRN